MQHEMDSIGGKRSCLLFHNERICSSPSRFPLPLSSLFPLVILPQTGTGRGKLKVENSNSRLYMEIAVYRYVVTDEKFAIEHSLSLDLRSSFTDTDRMSLALAGRNTLTSNHIEKF